MSRGRRYLLFLAGLTALSLAMVGVGYMPTRAAGGGPAITAMLLACAISLVGSALGGLPVALAREGGLEGLKRFVASMVLRLLAVAALAGLVIWLLGPEQRPFLLWLAISYLVLLAADTGFAWKVLERL